MADGLDESLSKLRLSKDEEEVAVFDEEISEDKAEEIELSFLGKLLTRNSFNVRA